MMDAEIESKIAVLKDKIKDLKTSNEVLQTYNVSLANRGILKKNYYYNYSVRMYENNQPEEDDKFKNSIVFDFALQWLLPSENSSFLSTAEDMPYAQIHLYLYFKKVRHVNPTLLRSYDITPSTNIEEVLSDLRQFWLESVAAYPEIESAYLGNAIRYLETD